MNNNHIQFFKAISDETRQRILESLTAGEKNVGRLSQELKLSQPRVSHHLKILNNADIIRMERRGKEIYCRLNRKYIFDCSREFFETYADGDGKRVQRKNNTE